MHIEFLVEEPSAEAALRNLVPKILGSGVEFRVIRFQGKQDLLSRLPGLLKGYRRWITADWRIVVLVDEDRQDCRELKAELESLQAMRSCPPRIAQSRLKIKQVPQRVSLAGHSCGLEGRP